MGTPVIWPAADEKPGEAISEAVSSGLRHWLWFKRIFFGSEVPAREGRVGTFNFVSEKPECPL